MRKFFAFPAGVVMFARRVLAVTFVISLCGCSTHPLPEDFSRKSTYDIVEKLRCEAREGIERENFSAQELENIFIGFDFTFDMTESNKADGGALDFLHPWGSGSFALGFTGKADKKRENRRFFRVVQSFHELKKYQSCSQDETRADLIYPIAGRVGLDEVIHTFTKLKRLTVFRDKDGSVFSDTLTFTTEFEAGVKPTLTLNSVAGSFRLTKASLNGSVGRKDEHKVVVAIAPRAVVKDITPLLYNRSLTAVPLVGTQNPAAGVIYELERQRSRDEDTRLFENLRPLP